MKRGIAIGSLVLLAAGCDPHYHLDYYVVNDSGKTIYVVPEAGHYGDGPRKVIEVPPDSAVSICSTVGIGFAKERYREDVYFVRNGYSYFSDSTLADSSLFQPSLEWQYHRSGIAYGSAALTIRKRDVK